MVKKAKYILSLLLFSIGFTFIGETYVWHLVSFETKYDYVTMYKNGVMSIHIPQEEMLKDITTAAKEENLEVFVVDRKISTIYSENINIYATEGTANYLKESSSVQPGHYQSIFLGDIQFEVLPITTIPDVNKFEKYYLIGDKENQIRFKQKLIDKYAGKFPQEGYSAFYSAFNISVTWVIILGLLLLITFYEVAQMRKEVALRIISGERLQHIIFRNVTADTLFFICTYLVLLLLFLQFTNANFHIRISLLMFAIFVVVNGCIFFTLFLSDFIKEMKSKDSVKKVLQLSYVYKIITICITVMLAAGCLTAIDEGLTFYKQKPFFENAKDYSYVNINVEDGEVTQQLRFDFYKEHLAMNNTLSLVDLQTKDLGSPFVFADSGSLDYLHDKISEFNTASLEQKVYFLVPEKYNSKSVQTEMIKIWETYYPHPYEFNMIAYKEQLDIIAIDKGFNISSKIVKNPIILFNNMDTNALNPYWNVFIFGTSMYKIQDYEWEQFIENNHLSLSKANNFKTNVYEHYLHQWNIYQKGIVISCVLLIVLLILEAIIIKTILNYEYSINAVEIALKKIMGYGLFERYKKLFLTTIIFGGIAGKAAFIIGHFLEWSSGLYLITGGLSVVILELCFVFYYIRITENRSIQSILKGGSVK